MGDTFGLARAGFWLNHADQVLNEVCKDQIRLAVITDDADESLFVVRQALVISAVKWIPDSAIKNGTMALVNKGTAGSGATTVSSHTAHDTPTAFAVTELTLSTASSATTVSAGEVLSLKRLTAGGAESAPAGVVEIEYTLRGLDT